MKKEELKVGGGKPKDTVADDRNWVDRVQNELNCTNNWNSQWGFLAGGLKKIDPAMVTARFSVEERLRELEKEVNEMGKEGVYKTSNMVYGTGDKLECFKNDVHNHKVSKDLRPLERRLPKNWKKEKWTPPEDPYDELKNLGKKKK